MVDNGEERYFARDFVEVFTELRGGECARLCTQKLNAATQAAVETGKTGSVTLTIKISPQGNQAMVSDTVKAVIPEFTPQPTVMFVDDEFNLSRRNPKQMNISDIIPTEEKGDVVKVDKDTGVVTTG